MLQFVGNEDGNLTCIRVIQRRMNCSYVDLNLKCQLESSSRKLIIHNADTNLIESLDNIPLV